MIKVGKADRWASRLASTIVRPGVAGAVAPRSAAAVAVAGRKQIQIPDHDLVLYDVEANPWCRLVREHATVLDLTLSIRPCPRETLLFGEGSFGPNSRFRPEAMDWYQKLKAQQQHQTDIDGDVVDADDYLTFPLLVDRTKATGMATPTGNDDNNNDNDNAGVTVVSESYEIVAHLWKHYGDSVLPTPRGHPRPDQIVNSSGRSIARRFLSLAGPSYLRPWPRCGLMRLRQQQQQETQQQTTMILYQSEGCPESRLVREALCGLEIPYRSVPVAEGSSNSLPAGYDSIPLLEVIVVDKDPQLQPSRSITGTDSNTNNNNTHTNNNNDPYPNGRQSCSYFFGAKDCLGYLREIHTHGCDNDSDNDNDNDNGPPETVNRPSWLDPVPQNNLGRSGGLTNVSVLTAVMSAMRKGHRAFVPERAME